MKTKNQWLFEAPFPSPLTYYADPYVDRESYNYPEALFAFKDKEVEEKELPIEQMRNYLQEIWKNNPILKRMAKAYGLQKTGQARQAALNNVYNILQQFTNLTGIKHSIVPDGTILKKLNEDNNFASLRSRRNYLEIESAVTQDPERFLREVMHEINAHYTGFPKISFFMRRNGDKIYANRLLDKMVENYGQLPKELNKLSESESEFKIIQGGQGGTVQTLPPNPWPRRLDRAEQAIEMAIDYLRQNQLRDFNNTLANARNYLREAATGIRERIWLSPRLVSIQVPIVEAQMAIDRAMQPGTNRRQAEAELRRAITSIEAARNAIGLRSLP
jgi:hypothetical protein